MSIFHVLNFISILLIIWLCYYLTYFIAGSKQSFVKSHISAIYYGKLKYVVDYYLFYIHNSIYLWSILTRVSLVCVFFMLVTAFSQDSIFQKKEFNFIVSPFLWMSISFLIYSSLRLIGKMKEYEHTTNKK